MLGVHRTTIYDLMRRDLPSFHVGRVRRIAVAEIEAWMARASKAERSGRS